MLCRRAAAFLYDSLLMLAACFVVTGAAVYLNDMESVAGFAYAMTLWIVGGLFLVLFWRNGRTLGMQAWKLRIVPLVQPHVTGTDADRKPVDDAADETAPRLPGLLLRYVLGTVLFGATWAWMLFDREGLALHDRLSRTRIVLDRRQPPG